MIIRNHGWPLLALALALELPLAAQQSAQIDFESVGRGAPVMVDAQALPPVGAAYARNTQEFIGSAPPGEVPDGIEPLPIDMFTSKDYYKDRALWSDPLYFRCNNTLALAAPVNGEPLEASTLAYAAAVVAVVAIGQRMRVSRARP